MGEVWKARDRRQRATLLPQRFYVPEPTGENSRWVAPAEGPQLDVEISHPNIANTRDSVQLKTARWIIAELVDLPDLRYLTICARWHALSLNTSCRSSCRSRWRFGASAHARARAPRHQAGESSSFARRHGEVTPRWSPAQRPVNLTAAGHGHGTAHCRPNRRDGRDSQCPSATLRPRRLARLPGAAASRAKPRSDISVLVPASTRPVLRC